VIISVGCRNLAQYTLERPPQDIGDRAIVHTHTHTHTHHTQQCNLEWPWVHSGNLLTFSTT